MRHLQIKTIILFILTVGLQVFAQKAPHSSKVPPAKNPKQEIAYLAGGCFWGMEELFRSQKGVIETEVGYMGDETPSPTYELIKTGRTNFAETIKVVFDPTLTNYQKMLNYFFKIHDPTTMNQQGNDKGTQYRSAIFYTTDEQKKAAEASIKKINQMKVWKKPIVTQISSAGPWAKAEDYHQDYLQKNPQGYTCHFERKIEL